MSASHADLSSVIAAYQGGKSVPALAAELGLPISTLYRRLKHAGLAMRKQSGRPPLADATIRHILKMSQEGRTYAEIKSETGASSTAVWKVRSSAGIVRPYAKPASPQEVPA